MIYGSQSGITSLEEAEKVADWWERQGYRVTISSNGRIYPRFRVIIYPDHQKKEA